MPEAADFKVRVVGEGEVNKDINSLLLCRRSFFFFCGERDKGKFPPSEIDSAGASGKGGMLKVGQPYHNQIKTVRNVRQESHIIFFLEKWDKLNHLGIERFFFDFELFLFGFCTVVPLSTKLGQMLVVSNN